MRILCGGTAFPTKTKRSFSVGSFFGGTSPSANGVTCWIVARRRGAFWFISRGDMRPLSHQPLASKPHPLPGSSFAYHAPLVLISMIFDDRNGRSRSTPANEVQMTARRPLDFYANEPPPTPLEPTPPPTPPLCRGQHVVLIKLHTKPAKLDETRCQTGNLAFPWRNYGIIARGRWHWFLFSLHRRKIGTIFRENLLRTKTEKRFHIASKQYQSSWKSDLKASSSTFAKSWLMDHDDAFMAWNPHDLVMLVEHRSVIRFFICFSWIAMCSASAQSWKLRNAHRTTFWSNTPQYLFRSS